MLRMRTWGLFVLLLLGTAVPAEAGDAKKLIKQFKKAVASDNESEALSLVSQIAGLGGEDALEGLYDIGFSNFSAKQAIYDAILQGFVQVEGAIPFVEEKYGKVRSKSDYREKVFQADVLIAMQASDAIESVRVLGEMINDKTVHAQSAAVLGMQKAMIRESVEPLIKLFESLLKKKRRDTVYYDVRDALLGLTGFEFDTIDDWWNWWEPVAASFDPKATDTGGKTGVERKRKDGNSDFFGVPILSKHVVFVLDISGSMSYVTRSDLKGLAKGDGSDSGGTQQPDEQPTARDRQLGKFWSRMEVAKRNLKRVVQRLKPGTTYNMVAFSSGTQVFKKKEVKASPGINKKAFKWIDGLKHKGETFTLEALKKAFASNGKTTDIYFLSDGQPSKDGKSSDPAGPILDEVRSMNRFRKVKIHTFGFPAAAYPSTQKFPPLVAANAFLKELAESTGGKFNEIKVNPKATPEDPWPRPDKEKGKSTKLTVETF